VCACSCRRVDFSAGSIERETTFDENLGRAQFSSCRVKFSSRRRPGSGAEAAAVRVMGRLARMGDGRAAGSGAAVGGGDRLHFHDAKHAGLAGGGGCFEGELHQQRLERGDRERPQRLGGAAVTGRLLDIAVGATVGDPPEMDRAIGRRLCTEKVADPAEAEIEGARGSRRLGRERERGIFEDVHRLDRGHG
jgi:hypothetical protein